MQVERYIDIWCPYCNIKEHKYRSCPVFHEKVKETTKEPYINENLNKNDEDGFCASGLLPYCVKEGKYYLMLVEEKRKEIFGINFIGGKRECCINEGEITLENSIQTAKNEFVEEIKEFCEDSSTLIESILNETPKRVFWSGSMTKYCLFPIEIPHEMMEVGKGIRNEESEIVEIHWMSIPEINSEIKIFGYIKKMLNDIIKIYTTERVEGNIISFIN